MQGEQLITQLSDLTGLPPEMVQKELRRLLAKSGLDAQALTLEDVRELLAVYLQDVLLQVKEAQNESQSA